jgi:hypothetical protein
LIAAASGTVSDAQSHADLRCCPVRTLRYGHLPSRLSVELTISLQSLPQYPCDGVTWHGRPEPGDSARLAPTVIRMRPRHLEIVGRGMVDKTISKRSKAAASQRSRRLRTPPAPRFRTWV